MAWKLDSSKPIYMQLMSIVKSRIVSGIYAPGDRFPSVRELATEAGVNPNTMQKALSELEHEGLITTNRTSGRFVTEDEIILNTIKDENVTKLIQDFYTAMSDMGYTKQEIISLFEKYMKDLP